MLARLKAAWHDPVWSKVIASAIIGVSALVLTALASLITGWGWLGGAAGYLAGTTPVYRGVLLALLIFGVGGAGVAVSYIALLRDMKRMQAAAHLELESTRRECEVRVAAERKIAEQELATERASHDAELEAVRAEALAAAKVAPQVPPKFDPESFEITPVRCRALLALSRRMEQRTTLHQLHDLATVDGELIDPDTSNAQVQHDMEDAERAGIVRIDRESGNARYYTLTIPDGRDWVLKNEGHLKTGLHIDMKRKPPKPRYF